jgi:hypothetical protein
MSPRFFACVLGGAFLTLGCGTDLGLGGGAKDGHFVAFGRLAASTRLSLPLNESGVLLGADLESRSELSVGSRWSAGLFAGYGSGPPPFGGRFGYEIYGELGAPLRGTYHGLDNSYLGIGGSLPIALSPSRSVIDLNRSTWLLKRSIEFVPFARLRGYFGQDEAKHLDRLEYGGGLAFRFRVMSDIL